MEIDCGLCEEKKLHEQNIRLAQAEMLADSTAIHVAELFKILGDATRIKLMHILSRREMCVCDLAATMQMGQSAISHQLRVLRNARLVKYRKVGKEAWYSLDDEHIELLLGQGLEHVSHN